MELSGTVPHVLLSGCPHTTPVSTAMSPLPNSSPSSVLDDEFSASLQQQLRPLGIELADIQAATCDNIQYDLTSRHTFASVPNWCTVVACWLWNGRVVLPEVLQSVQALMGHSGIAQMLGMSCWWPGHSDQTVAQTLRPGANTALLPHTVRRASHSTLSKLSVSKSTVTRWGRTECGGFASAIFAQTGSKREEREDLCVHLPMPVSPTWITSSALLAASSSTYA